MIRNRLFTPLIVAAMLCFVAGVDAQTDYSVQEWKARELGEKNARNRPQFIYLEEKVPDYTLPDPLVALDGKKVDNARQWTRNRRGEILDLFETHVYGKAPGRPEKMTFDVFDDEKKALDGIARRKQIAVNFTGKPDGPTMDVLLYLPKTKEPVPIFLLLNFGGNHTVSAEPAIRITESWVRSKSKGGSDHRATEKSRGASASRYPIEQILKRGYGVATIYYGDIDPDFHDEFKNGIHGALDDPAKRKDDSWGSIAAWAWGLSSAMDYFETDADIDNNRVAVLGHSRLGKTSLWAGATDPRFAIVISNDSGCGGAALSRRRFGESVARINTSFPHWFCENFKQYNDNEAPLPVDQHMLIALAAPRPVYIASAESDLWADPRGEFLSALNASPVYELFGKQGVGVDEMPPLNKPVGDMIGYHIRSGSHNLSEYDWQRYMDFADRHYGVAGD